MQCTSSKKMLWRVLLPGVLAVALILLIGLDLWKSQRESAFEQSGLAMGTVVTAQLYGPGGEEAAETIFSAIKTLEAHRLSWRLPSSDIARVNAAAGTGVPVDPQTIGYLQQAAEVSKKSGGAFDCTTGQLTQLWDIGGENARVPAQAEINAALQTVGYQNVRLQGGQAAIAKGQSLDLGAIGKGIACDEIVPILEQSHLSGAVISVGGSILLWGQRPGGGDWKIGVRDPRGEASDQLGSFSLSEGYVSTSGDYERTLTVNGQTYHHILNPKTGYPADAGLISVTVTAPTGLLSDALSTACFVLGYQDSLPLLKEFHAEAIFVTQERAVLVTEGLRQSFTLTNGDYHLVDAG
ncbi:MAG TPA: FAD:protein FMN transferase [Candidatus Fimivicinus intestinavium]|nr:FAD:protein FMN transferase [Candidatus Fimivicinus intestinavium]